MARWIYTIDGIPAPRWLVLDYLAKHPNATDSEVVKGCVERLQFYEYPARALLRAVKQIRQSG
jgi:hypothetical protein